ncbi:MAG: EscU/YscU/HrcU family type III secretion system export apparatus switch protein [Myxococcales bacterium]|nr:EscU/YscU/HrcU family type III secretion system export apparatus switch protein [Polyangiaceae bacterium]MDW8251077.1 EscU/YscU/HrcU family type III secretion system export apparatus switch protein [Myxococcales bacterium]
MSNKTEEPTPRRLARAIEQGDVPVSPTLVSAGALFGAALLLPTTARMLADKTGLLLRRAPELLPGEAAVGALAALALTSLPPLTVAAVLAGLLGAVQARGSFAPGKLAPNLARLSGGLRALASAQRVMSLLRALVTAALVALLCWKRFRAWLPELAACAGDARKAVAFAGQEGMALLRDVGLLLVVSSVVDLALTVRAWRNRLKMSPDEVKREAKESEGDPQFKAAREQAHHELLQQATLHAVKEASVVIVNPTHLATALRYREGEDEAPLVLAKGAGTFAAQIVDAARAYNVPVLQDVPLARALHELEVGDQIPEALYEAVAEVLRSLWETTASCESPGEAHIASPSGAGGGSDVRRGKP